MKNFPIGIFDSGIGGISTFSEIAKLMPKEDIIYLGDTKNLPYGEKSDEQIIKFTKKNIDFLLMQNVKLIIIACGTSTSIALEKVKKYYNIPIIGIIEPTVEWLKKQKNNKKIGVIATEGTIRSNCWEKKIKEKIEEAIILNKACPKLVHIAEEEKIDDEKAKEAINGYMKIFKDEKIDKLILGCTHYPLFRKYIENELGKDVELIDTAEKVAAFVKEYLKKNRLENTNGGKYEIYLTKTDESFENKVYRKVPKYIKVNLYNI